MMLLQLLVAVLVLVVGWLLITKNETRSVMGQLTSDANRFEYFHYGHLVSLGFSFFGNFCTEKKRKNLPSTHRLRCIHFRRCRIRAKSTFTFNRKPFIVLLIFAILVSKYIIIINTFINSTLDSRGLSKRNNRRKLSSNGSNCANYYC